MEITVKLREWHSKMCSTLLFSANIYNALMDNHFHRWLIDLSVRDIDLPFLLKERHFKNVLERYSTIVFIYEGLQRYISLSFTNGNSLFSLSFDWKNEETRPLSQLHHHTTTWKHTRGYFIDRLVLSCKPSDWMTPAPTTSKTKRSLMFTSERINSQSWIFIRASPCQNSVFLKPLIDGCSKQIIASIKHPLQKRSRNSSDCWCEVEKWTVFSIGGNGTKRNFIMICLAYVCAYT